MMEIGKEKRHHDDEKIPLLQPKSKSNAKTYFNWSFIQKLFPVHPSDAKKQFWDAIVFLCIVYNCLSIPISLSFRNLWKVKSNMSFFITLGNGRYSFVRFQFYSRFYLSTGHSNSIWYRTFGQRHAKNKFQRHTKVSNYRNVTYQ